MPAEVWIDNSLILVSILLGLITVRTLKDRTTAAVAAFFLFFPAWLVFMNMWAHTVAVLITAYKRYTKGTFQYSFHFYGLMLLGLVGITISGLAIHYGKKVARGYRRYKGTLYTLHLLIAALFLPVGFINPLGFLPVMAAIVSMLTLRLSGRKKARPILQRSLLSATPELQG